MSLSVTRLEWMDAPVVPHAVADALAAAARPRDLGAPPPTARRNAPFLSRAPVLAFVFVAHIALVAAAAYAWRESLRLGDHVEEIPVEIVIDAGVLRAEEPLAAPPPLAAQAQTAEAAVEEPTLPAAMAVAEPADIPEQPAPVMREASADSAAETPAASLPPAPTAQPAAQVERDRLEAAARERARRVAQESAALAAQRRAQEIAQERAEERADMERERRAQARRAAEREKQAQAVQERRRIAARSLASEATRPAAAQFDAAGYRSIVARAVSASTRSACSSGGGRVVVAMMIGPSGRIASASLSSASGNSALDAAALASVRRAGPFPAPSNRATISVPIVVMCR